MEKPIWLLFNITNVFVMHCLLENYCRQKLETIRGYKQVLVSIITLRPLPIRSQDFTQDFPIESIKTYS